jgi:hypothetical protein
VTEGNPLGSESRELRSPSARLERPKVSIDVKEVVGPAGIETSRLVRLDQTAESVGRRIGVHPTSASYERFLRPLGAGASSTRFINALGAIFSTAQRRK